MVAIIVPLYKAKDTLPDLLNSLVAQTKKMFMVILVQDCDGEDYSDIVKEYSENRGLHITLLSTPENQGPGMARQVGIDAAGMCDYVMFCDADDMLMPRAVEMLYSEAKRNSADFVCSNFIAEQKNTPGVVMDSLKIPVTWIHGKLYSRKFLIEKDIRFLPNFKINEDSYFNFVVANCCEKRINIPEITHIWRDNKSSLTRSINSEEFFRKGSSNYIESQAMGLIKVFKTGGKMRISTIAQTIMNIYTHMMLQIHYKIEDDSYFKYLDELRNMPEIEEVLNNSEFWHYVISKTTQGQLLENNVFVFYRERICDWIDYFLRRNK